MRPTEKFGVDWEGDFTFTGYNSDLKDQLVKFHKEIFPHLEIGELEGDAEAYLRDCKDDEILNKATLLLLDKKTKEIIATTMVYLNRDIPQIMALGVKEEYRNRGIATNLVKHQLSALSEKYSVVRIGVDKDSNAYRLYKKMGFSEGLVVEDLCLEA